MILSLLGVLLVVQAPSVHGACGATPVRPSLEGFIVGGVQARPHSIPWQISLGVESWDWDERYTYDEGHTCGGTIINERYILTAAHCFSPGEKVKYYIRAGAHSLRKKTHAPEQKIQVEKVIIHQGYDDDDGMTDDIALLKLAEPLEFSDAVQPICLPDPQHSWREDQSYLVTGWGAFGENKGYPDRLRQVIVPHFNSAKCGKLPYYGEGAIHKKVICAGYPRGSKDACEGDSGGPLATRVKNTWTLAGVVSWGVGCGGKNSPGVYTNVAMYIGWINNNTH